MHIDLHFAIKTVKFVSDIKFQSVVCPDTDTYGPGHHDTAGLWVLL